SSLEKAFHNPHRGAAHARHEFAVLREYLDTYTAGTLHFDALMDFERRSELEAALMHEVGAERPGRRSCSGIFGDFPRKHATREGCTAVLGREAVRHGCRSAEHAPQRGRVRLDLSQSRTAADRNHKIKNSGGNEFDRQRWIEI